MRESTKGIIKKHNIRLTKSLGQNFLTDNTVIKRIVDVAHVADDDIVVEVGPGIGNMTRELATRAGKVAAVEIDRYLIPALEENLEQFSNVTIINEDILKMDLIKLVASLQEIDGVYLKSPNIKVVANLPYYITTPIIMKFLEEDPQISSMVFMIQKEVAERMIANPGGKDYGALSVAVQYYSKPEIVFNVPPHCFIPQPGVESSVIRLNILSEPPVKLHSKELFFKTVKASFGQRRKTLVNALSNSNYFKATKEEIKHILNNIDIDENQRGETLTIMQFAQLANAFFEKNSQA